jgi:hypothetical protein
MSNNETVIIVSWRTSAMKAHAHNCYHAACYEGTRFPNQQVREVDVQEIAVSATCCGCWQRIRDVQEVKV